MKTDLILSILRHPTSLNHHFFSIKSSFYQSKMIILSAESHRFVITQHDFWTSHLAASCSSGCRAAESSCLSDRPSAYLVAPKNRHFSREEPSCCIEESSFKCKQYTERLCHGMNRPFLDEKSSTFRSNSPHCLRIFNRNTNLCHGLFNHAALLRGAGRRESQTPPQFIIFSAQKKN